MNLKVASFILLASTFVISTDLSAEVAGRQTTQIQKGKPNDRTLNEPCGKVSVIKYGQDEIEVIIRPIGADANRGEIFKKQDFDLNTVSQVALKAFEMKVLFCAQMNKDNKLEYYISR